MGKAIDIDFNLAKGEGKREDFNRCNQARSLLCEKSNFQIGWYERNKKSFEPENIAPTWIHMDIRNYIAKYLDDIFFVTSLESLKEAIC